MSKTVWRITPVNGYDIPGLEGWLEKQAVKGLIFSMTAGVFTLFQKSEPRSLQFHLEPAPNKPDRVDPELNALYEEAGWQYLGLFRSSFAVFVTENPDAQAHTDPEVWSYALGRFLRRKLLGGIGLLIGNFLLLQLYSGGVGPYTLSNIWYFLHWYPVETLTNYPLIALVLSVIGLALVDLSWLLGLVSLCRYRKTVSAGKTPPRHTRGGGLLAAGVLILAVVLAETLLLVTNLSYQPYPLEGSGFVTLTELEGDDFQLTRDSMYNMDYISHNRSLLEPESWHFRQYGIFSWNEDGSKNQDVPYLKLSAYHYRLPWLAEKMTEEQNRIRWNGGEYQTLSPAYGLDEILISHDAFDPERDTYPGTRLILRWGNTVLLAEYRGNQDLEQFLPRFAQMMEQL